MDENMKINGNLLAIKVHFFCFMSAAGPILPYTVVLGKQLGLSELLLGTINGILPLLYIVIKPLAGFIMDYFHERRSTIFSISIILMAVSYYSISFTLSPNEKNHNLTNDKISSETDCWFTQNDFNNCLNSTKFIESVNSSRMTMEKNADTNLFSTYLFIVCMSAGMIMFNICNSYSDTICFDILGQGNEADYGKQRLWGTLGYGLAGGLSGFLIDIFSKNSIYKNHTPAFVILAIFSIADVIVSFKLKLPGQNSSSNILKDAVKVLHNRNVILFLFLTTIFGTCDGFVVYFVFWYLEDVSMKTGGYEIIRSIEGAIIMGQMIIGEVFFFQFSGYIIKKLGYNASFVLCLVAYAVRFYLLSVIPNVWWAIPIETIFQGFYALSYTLIVSYTNFISTPGIQATMQSVSMAAFDGLGYAFGSFFGAVAIKIFGGRYAFALFSYTCFAIVFFILSVLMPSYIRQKLRKNSQYECI